jgi:hypothetical protein
VFGLPPFGAAPFGQAASVVSGGPFVKTGGGVIGLVGAGASAGPRYKAGHGVVGLVGAGSEQMVAKARLSHEPVEVLVKPNPHANLSHEPVEVLHTAAIAGGLSHYPVEVLGQHIPPEIDAPFIPSHSRVFPPLSIYSEAVAVGPGNGGELHHLLLNANGASETPTLAGGISSTATLLHLTGDGGLPVTNQYILKIDDEHLLVAPIGSGAYRIRGRGQGNTTPNSHSNGAVATWDDSYDMAIVASSAIGQQFAANITGSGLQSYFGWLMAFDSSQAYLAGNRYPMHITEVMGVFDAGAGVGGTNRCDAAQPNAVCTPVGASDDCPAALSNPSRMIADVNLGDVAVVRYTNPAGAILELGVRSAALQSWFGIKRVDNTDNDVTTTDPTGIAFDTTGGAGTYTGTINGEWFNPSSIGIGPDTGTPTPNNVPYTSVTLPGTNRKFTHGGSAPTYYNEKGWPICALAVRQGTRRIPFWRSWDWHDFNFVYAGWADDATFCQMVINRNGIIFGSVPEVALPGSQNIDGPDAVWDDGSYHFGASWGVVLWAGAYFVAGPSIGGGVLPVDAGAVGFVPVVTFGGGPGTPVVAVPPDVEGGGGGGINPPGVSISKMFTDVSQH